MRIGKGAALAAILLGQLALASAAQAQAEFLILSTINSLGSMPSDVACQKGTPFPANAIAATRRVAMLQMQGYWNAVMNGGAPLDYFLLNKRTRWTFGTTVLDKKTIATLKDPWAAPGNVLAIEPLGYALAGDGTTALGQWQVRDAIGTVIGTYQASFDMTKEHPRISALTLVDSRTWVDPVEQYCHVPGDVIGYRLKLAREAVAFAEPRLAAAKQTETAARDRAEKARAAALATPDNAGKQEAARKAEAELAVAVNGMGAYQAMVDKNRAELAAAEADQARLDGLRAAGKAALAAAGS
jgi:hypothetical protein